MVQLRVRPSQGSTQSNLLFVPVFLLFVVIGCDGGLSPELKGLHGVESLAADGVYKCVRCHER